MALARRVVRALATALAVVVAVVLWRAATLPSRQPRSHATGDVRQTALVRVLAGGDETDAVVARLAEALRVPTISYEDRTRFNGTAFLELHAILRRQFPRVHASLRVEAVNTYSLLYRWAGTRPTLKPAMVAGHLDVVPIDPSTEHLWTQPPFGGVVGDGLIWGRGTLDDKFAVWAMMEAIERLLADGFRPERTIYLALGHDEEIGGWEGARKIADLLHARNESVAFIVDEGVPIINDNLLPGHRIPLAAPGLSEKGHLNVILSIGPVTGGHSSSPPDHTAVGLIGRAVAAVEAHPLPLRLQGPGRVMLEYLAPELPFWARIPMANLWLFQPALEALLWHDRSLRSFFWTTQAVTIIQGGIKSNVVPQTASATVNFRIAPWESTQIVRDHVQALMDADPLLAGQVQVTAEEGEALEPSPITDPRHYGVHVLSEALHDAFADDVGAPAWLPDLVVAPSIMVGNTDTRHYWDLTPCILRLSPAVLARSDLARIHGVDERISVQAYRHSIVFFHRLFVRAQEAADVTGTHEHGDL